eukprot:SRR837773.5559.p2 GENE.SRR837773.5559~~SRR837773.5559.p2  ORF type:complete len:168 (+),score=47.73 SRR837773.5559:70-504(+)
MSHADTVQAFLHYSFVRSGGQLLVADLQGVARAGEVLLTDPQVLTAERREGLAFGPGDLGLRGLRACLAAHRCGPTCKMLGLKPVSAKLLRKLDPAGSAGCRRATSKASAGGSDWDRVSEYNLTDVACSESQASASSWVHLLEG